MVEYILLASMAAVVVLLIILRTNTAVCFLALCAGTVLLSSSGANTSLIATSLTSGVSSSANVARIALLFAPLLATALLLRNHLYKSMLPLALVPAIATAFLSVIFIAPELSESAERAVVETDTWRLLVHNQEAIVVFGLAVSILMLAMTVKKPHDKHKKGHH